MEVLMETIKVQERQQLKALEWALNEITDNVLNHAESPTGGIVQIQSFTNLPMISSKRIMQRMEKNLFLK
jgi:anti-sigma regulatory factor (Ser/Thr protein kinase)